jgi:5-methyltetrahydropteroyltriglutamate--homocysteine methyltransferase
MKNTLTRAPFKADDVSSSLRFDSLHNVKRKFPEGNVTAEQLREVGTKEIKS